MPKKTPEPELLVVRTITTRMRVPLSAYPKMNVIQAIDYELQQPRAEKIEAFTLALEATPENEIELTETVKQYDGS